METSSLMQYFARSNQGQMVSVHEVPRGLACECICPECGHTVIARQGNIKAWHFAHASGADCPGGAMTALHLAAQELIQRVAKIRVPELVATATGWTTDGELISETVERPIQELAFDEVSLEVNIGDIQPDVVGSQQGERHFIEIAVTHFVDEQKRQKLAAHGVPTLEVDLSGVVAYDWQSLHAQVIDQVELKRWVHHPALADMQAQADQAVQLRIAQDHQVDPLPSATMRAVWSRTFHFNQARVYVDGFPQHIRIRQTHYLKGETFSAMHSLIRSLGGRTTGDRFWSVPLPAKEALLDGLKRMWSAY